MAERVFSAGFVWRVIEQKWPGFEEAFLGFEPKTLLFQPEDFWHDLTSDKRIVRNGQKIMSVQRERGLRREHRQRSTAASENSSPHGRRTTRSG